MEDRKSKERTENKATRNTTYPARHFILFVGLFFPFEFNNRSYAVSDPTGNFASGRAEDSKSFSRTFGSQSQMFVKKIAGVFSAAGNVGRIKTLWSGQSNSGSIFVLSRTSRYSYDVRGGRSIQAFQPMKARFACGSMVLYLSVFPKYALRAYFGKTDEIFCPAGGGIPWRIRSRVTCVTQR